MVIHDLKHPTESLINSVENILSKFDYFEKKLKFIEHEGKNTMFYNLNPYK